MSDHIVYGIDLAKSVFQFATYRDSKILNNRKLSRRRLIDTLSTIPLGTVVMEACYSAHHWARYCESLGHTVKLLPAQHVKPFTLGNKTDANDVIAIIEASFRPTIRSVPTKTIQQQDIQSIHRMRERMVSAKRSLMNQTRHLLAEYGLVENKGRLGFIRLLEGALNSDDLSGIIKEELTHCMDELARFDASIKRLEARLSHYLKTDRNAQILHTIPGIGLLNATALACKYGNGQQFTNKREMGVHLGLTPMVSASGLKSQTRGISKRGNSYSRKQLVQGARALLMVCHKHLDDGLCRWAVRLKERRGFNVAAVALANRMSRIAWVLLQKGEHYKPA